jgi:hypothetical protein
MHYRLFLLEEGGRVRARFGLQCTDDEAAIKDAILFAKGEALEVWQEKRLVYRSAWVAEQANNNTSDAANRS